MALRAILADSPDAWVVFQFQGEELRARFDPMWMGAENLVKVLDSPGLIRRIFDQDSQMRLTLADPFSQRIDELFEAYLGAVGLSMRRLGILVHALEHVEDLEVDLLRVGLDVRDWLDPEGGLSSRRVALIVEDLFDRPESRIGAAYMGILPADKAAIGIAQYLSDKDDLHRFLWSPEELEKDVEKQREEEAKRARIMARSRQVD
ncbi:hypothetical protein COJE103337_03870 [Corynebacterium jeikeium]|uniref:hypothetical protein n=1 Tax=Corynebacterium jeikeium TaxID=38289 RepID=UPI0001B714FE|nr:hypothetical protein [Corynebacterium jeikeium]EEW17386.1 hypothetical protein HMPREF0297_0263 [Corynebacterium jeikeium ATCC 43734]OOD30754.1 hypothetical protein BWP03_06765 [Corynebacterium jeikeium]WCZ54132.1 hypothetical protein CJEIK_08185 [Corynebacterium jeikeium]SUY80562.1 Uncharacterised protein [Corynebacterium jeikeium]